MPNLGPLRLVEPIRRTLWGLLLLCCLLGGAGCEEIEDGEKRAQNLTRTVMSPFCPGRTLDSCPSPKAAEWRADIRKWVAEGVSNDEIRNRLYGRVPKEDLTGGPNTGVGVWFPIAGAALALGLLVVVLRRVSAAPKVVKPKAPNPVPPPDDASLDARLDEEIRDSN